MHVTKQCYVQAARVVDDITDSGLTISNKQQPFKLTILLLTLKKLFEKKKLKLHHEHEETDKFFNQKFAIHD